MQPHGQFDAGVDAGRNDAALKRAESGRPGRARVQSLAALLALPLQAQAQTDPAPTVTISAPIHATTLPLWRRRLRFPRVLRTREYHR